MYNELASFKSAGIYLGGVELQTTEHLQVSKSVLLYMFVLFLAEKHTRVHFCGWLYISLWMPGTHVVYMYYDTCDVRPPLSHAQPRAQQKSGRDNAIVCKRARNRLYVSAILWLTTLVCKN